MSIPWRAIADFIAQISKLALEWFREVNKDNPSADPRLDYQVRKAVSVVLDPDTKETSAAEVSFPAPADDPAETEVD